MARAKKRHAEGHENAERWLLTYADLITLLMVFFVVLYSMSQADAVKFTKLQTALARAFHVGVLQGDDPTKLRGDDGSNPVRTIVQETISNPTGAPLDNRLITTVDELRSTLLQLPMPAQQSSGMVQVGLVRDGVVISLSGNVLFDSGRADLKPAGLAMLDVLAERLRAMPNSVRIEGHTDATPIDTAAYPSNWELSAARAVSVARYLTQFGQIRPERLVAAGFGEYRPVAPNNTRDGRARNRRVDIVVIFDSVPAAAGPTDLSAARPPSDNDLVSPGPTGPGGAGASGEGT